MYILNRFAFPNRHLRTEKNRQGMSAIQIFEEEREKVKGKC